MGERRGVYSVMEGKLGGKISLENPCVDGKVILRRIFRK
jgi:hypothetical protein